jgi:hypothetical protein
VEWARSWGEGGSIVCADIEADGLAGVYIVGDFFAGDDFDFDAGTESRKVVARGGRDAFLARFDPEGEPLWIRTWGGVDSDVALAVAVDSCGDVSVGGSFSAIVDFDPGDEEEQRNSEGWTEAFVSTFDSKGNFIWVATGADFRF